MNVIPTRPALPARVWRWVSATLGAFWAGFGAHVRNEFKRWGK